jgi:hypothetical protein
MHDVKIKSESQSGGITAQNVNSTVKINTTDNEKKNRLLKRVFWWIFGVSGVIGTIVVTISAFK